MSVPEPADVVSPNVVRSEGEMAHCVVRRLVCTVGVHGDLLRGITAVSTGLAHPWAEPCPLPVQWGGPTEVTAPTLLPDRALDLCFPRQKDALLVGGASWDSGVT